MTEMHKPTHVGVVLKSYFTKWGSVRAGAAAMGMNKHHLSKIISGRKRMTAFNAIKIGEYTNTEPIFWCNLQSQYDIWIAKGKEADKK